jgi:aminoglycoside 3-N-acetyltransferase
MPFYPLKRSYEFLVEGKPFDLRQHRTSMGALAIALAKRPEARKSLHPTKSVVVVGPDRDFLIGDHHKSPYPYSALSPYARACAFPRCKIIGLGVDDYLAAVHVAVDENEEYPVHAYHLEPLVGFVIDTQGVEHRVLTYAHDNAITSTEDVPRFMIETRCPTYREGRIHGRPFFYVEGPSMVQHVRDQGKRGVTFFYR